MAKIRRSLKVFWAFCYLLHFILVKSSFSKKRKKKEEVDKSDSSAILYARGRTNGLQETRRN